MQFQNRLSRGAPYGNYLVRSSLVFIIFLLATAGLASAVERVSLYTTERIIAQDASDTRQVEVLADALNEVLIRVSGLSELPNSRVLSDARRSPQDLLNRFSLGESEETIPDAIGNPQPTYNLDLRFERSLINELLANAGIPVWTPVRPTVLLLLAGPDGQRIDVLRENPDFESVSVAQEQARYQGLPLQWPLMDLEDSLTVQAEDIWGGFSENMLAMAERYQTDSVLGGYVGLQPETGRWVGRWHLVNGGVRTSETYFGATQEEVVRAGIRMAAQTFSERYALDLSGGAAETLEFSVMNLTNLQTHGAVRRYLNNMLGVENLQMLGLDGDVARYRLQFAADSEKWLDSLALEDRLQEAQTIRSMGQAAELELIWRD